MENELPDELLGETDNQGTVSNGPCPTMPAPKPLVQSQLQSPYSNSVGGNAAMPAPQQIINPSSRQQPGPPKHLTQLLQSGRSSPKYPGNTPSPGNAGIGSPHPSRQVSQPQPSPASNSMQSPNAGSLIGNIKSPVNASAGTSVSVNRTPGNMRTTPSPRVLSSLAMSSSINSPLVHTSMQNAVGFTRNIPPAPQNQANVSNQTMGGVVPQHMASNGPVQPQMQILPQQNVGNMQGMQPNLNNMPGMQGNFNRSVNSSTVMVN